MTRGICPCWNVRSSVRSAIGVFFVVALNAAVARKKSSATAGDRRWVLDLEAAIEEQEAAEMRDQERVRRSELWDGDSTLAADRAAALACGWPA